MPNVESNIDADEQITYEEAEVIIDSGRPQVLREIDQRNHQGRKDRQEAILAQVELMLIAQGNTLPVSGIHAETIETGNPVVTKTLREWRLLIAKATLEIHEYKITRL